MSKINININGRELTGFAGQTILDVARENGIDIPTLCHDERVKTYGACGVCVVEAEDSPRLWRACSTSISEGMIIKTETEKVVSARQAALELLLSDHIGDCRPPCEQSCPANTDCQGYAGLIANGQYSEAVRLIKEKLPFPSSIGRVCPHPCEEACRRKLVEEPVSIAQLKYFVSDADLNSGDAYIPEIPPSTGCRIAIAGGGPGGLTAGYYLRLKGHEVDIYDAMPRMGGMLRYGIPEYRLPKSVLDKESDILSRMGINFINNVKIGRDMSLEYLRESHDAVVLAIGAWKSIKLGCPGEELQGVMGGIDFLRDIAQDNHVRLGNRVAVVGGGNTAMDACRTAIRLGAEEVYCIYRRTRAEMPAEEIEIDEALEEGVIFKFLTNPIEITGNDFVNKIRLQKMKLGEPDAGGRRIPVPIEGAEEAIEIDTVIIAIGQGVNPDGLDGVSLTRRGTISADENTFRTNMEGVFAVGDATNKGAGIAIEAIGEAGKAAEVIHSYLSGRIIPYSPPILVKDEVSKEKYAGREKIAREKMNCLPPDIRKHSFEEVNLGYCSEQAAKEAGRCLECGCADYFECKLIAYANQYCVDPKKYGGNKHSRPVDTSNPFFYRNPNKCILCGLCVRVCDEVIGRTALGLVDRGFDAVVKPAMGRPIWETDCISCGSCVQLCPTGALGEILPLKKTVPVKENSVNSVCSFCSVGCGTKLAYCGSDLYRSLPDDDNKSLLCSKGRFGFGVLQKNAHIIKPMIARNGKLTDSTLKEVCEYIRKKVLGITSRYGAEALAVTVSDKYTNEEIFIIKRYAEDVLKTGNIGSFGYMRSGVEDVFGYDASIGTLEELPYADVVLLVSDDIMSSHTIAGIRVKQAVENGATLILVSRAENQASEWASMKIKASEDLSVLVQMNKALLDIKAYGSEGLDELAEFLQDTEPRDEIKRAMEIYARAKNAMIVFDQYAVTADAARLLANMAVITGHVGKSRNGIIQLKPNNNSQGLADIGIRMGYEELTSAIGNGEIKALLIFGEDVPEVDLTGLEFLAVQDCIDTETTEKAYAVLPGPLPHHRCGTYTGTDGRIRKVTPAAVSESVVNSYQIIDILSGGRGFKSMYHVQAAIAASIHGYENIVDVSCRPSELHESSLRYNGKKAVLRTPSKAGPGIMYGERYNTNAEYNRFMAFMRMNGK